MGPAARQQLLPRADRRPAAADHRPRADHDGILHFTNLQLYSPKLRLSGAGIRRRTAPSISRRAGGRRQYGPLRMVLDGRIERPQGRPVARQPQRGDGHPRHAAVRSTRRRPASTIAPTASRGSGRSRRNGQILLPKGGRTTIAIAALDVAGTTARGDLRADPGGFTGKLALAGGGIDGTLGFRPVDGDQRIEAHLAANNVQHRRAAGVQRPLGQGRRDDPARRGADLARRGGGRRADLPMAAIDSRG